MKNKTEQTKKKRRRNRRTRRFMLLFCLLMFSLVVVTGIRQGAEQLPKYNIESFLASENSPIQNVGTQNQSEGDWCLVLVNKKHPLKGDYKIELTKLSNGEYVDSRIYPQLQRMFDDMRQEGVYPVVASGYRTAQKQQELLDRKYNEYITKGYSKAEAKKEAKRWVLVPGTSEHQLGIGLDINADGIHSDGKEVYSWLSENAHRYGFIYRYQEDKVNITGIANEPWHYRYVGVEAATKIYERNICLEEYLEAIH